MVLIFGPSLLFSIVLSLALTFLLHLALAPAILISILAFAVISLVTMRRI